MCVTYIDFSRFNYLSVGGKVQLVNHTMLCDGKKMRVRNAIDKYISSFTSAIETGNAGKILFPILVRNNKLMDDTDG